VINKIASSNMGISSVKYGIYVMLASIVLVIYGALKGIRNPSIGTSNN
jgi:hypothetical protein